MYPTLLHIGSLSLPTFGLLAAAGLLCGLLLSERTARLAGIDPASLWNAGLFAVIAAFVFSRALLAAQHWRSFVRFPVLLLAAPSLTASGLLLTAIAIFLWLWLTQIPIRRTLDAWAPCATLVWVFLALGHFAEGSDPGMPSRFGSPHPVALYTAVAAITITLATYRQLLRSQRPGEVAGTALAAAGLAQFFLCFLRVPGIESLAGLDLLEWVALAMIAAGAGLLLTARNQPLNSPKTPQKPPQSEPTSD